MSEELCESIITTLVGQRLESFTRVSTIVRKAMEAALLRILTPKKSTDVLREILDAKAAGRAYSIVFVGVNGVGKSTSLSKVCYYLKSKGVKVMLAACDTFRSGAVEQLNQHAKVLDVPLFEKGYAKDPAVVAKEAIKYGTENGYDCVLIDTAGRMQNNEPLMRALAKLVSTNDPDLVLFVGEALVGNDGIDQLSMFDRALADYSDRREPHRIDGIVITKFDTIDDKGESNFCVHVWVSCTDSLSVLCSWRCCLDGLQDWSANYVRGHGPEVHASEEAQCAHGAASFASVIRLPRSFHKPFA